MKTYKNLINDQNDFIRQVFDCKKVKYDTNGTGRIIEMHYKQVR